MAKSTNIKVKVDEVIPLGGLLSLYYYDLTPRRMAEQNGVVATWK